MIGRSAVSHNVTFSLAICCHAYYRFFFFQFNRKKSNGNPYERILCKVQWNIICKLWNKQILKWPVNWTKCQLENFSISFWSYARWAFSKQRIAECIFFFVFFYFHSFNHLFSSRRTEDDDPEDNERSNFGSNVSTILLRFRDKEWELTFMKEPDFMLKYSVLLCFIVFIGIFIVQSLNSPYVIHKLRLWHLTFFFLLSNFTFKFSCHCQQWRNHLLAAKWMCIFRIISHFGNYMVQKVVGTFQSNQWRWTKTNRFARESFALFSLQIIQSNDS